ncbi:hypothetical protein BMY_0078 [Wohlfahrtiimonas chitiniclastica]|nr:hypothetical protein BMY_0078 [Wohlfahrtiimonas chitiniclastica]
MSFINSQFLVSEPQTFQIHHGTTFLSCLCGSELGAWLCNL